MKNSEGGGSELIGTKQFRPVIDLRARPLIGVILVEQVRPQRFLNFPALSASFSLFSPQQAEEVIMIQCVGQNKVQVRGGCI